jgi:hypothetical protein
MEAGAKRSKIRTHVGRGAPALLMPGTTLIRECEDRRHRVIVTPDGLYAFNGEVFKSLSAEARHITGTRWNGPRFFGLRDGKADMCDAGTPCNVNINIHADRATETLRGVLRRLQR